MFFSVLVSWDSGHETKPKLTRHPDVRVPTSSEAPTSGTRRQDGDVRGGGIALAIVHITGWQWPANQNQNPRGLSFSPLPTLLDADGRVGSGSWAPFFTGPQNCQISLQKRYSFHCALGISQMAHCAWLRVKHLARALI